MTSPAIIALPAQRQPEPDRLQIAALAFLARYKPASRRIYTNVLRTYTGWCIQNGLDPMAVIRPHIELFSRWLEEQNYARSTRAKYVSGVYRFATMDGYLTVDPALNVARPKWPTDSPALGLTHLQFEAMLHTSSESANIYDFALVAMLGLLGLRRAEASNAQIGDLGLERGHRVLKVIGKGEVHALVPLPPVVQRAIDRAVDDRLAGWILLNTWGRQTDGRSLSLRLKWIARNGGVKVDRMYPHLLRHAYVTTMLDAGVDLRDAQIAARHADPRTTERYDRARGNLDRHGNYRLAAFMSGATG